MPAPPPAPRVPKEDRHFVTALARGLEVLACFRSGDKVLGNQEIAQRCRLPKSTVSRLTYTLTRLGYLIHVEDAGKYRLGTATLSLGSAMLVRLDVRQIARPLMQELADFAKAEVSLGTRDRFSMIYVENCRSSALLTLSLDVGSRIALATSAMGRAWLAAVPEEVRSPVLEQMRARGDKLAWGEVQAGIDKALQVRRVAAQRERHRPRLPPRRRPAADGDQLRRPVVQPAARVPARRGAPAPDRDGGAHRGRALPLTTPGLTFS